jgi:hypothetical protein
MIFLPAFPLAHAGHLIIEQHSDRQDKAADAARLQGFLTTMIFFIFSSGPSSIEKRG